MTLKHISPHNSKYIIKITSFSAIKHFNVSVVVPITINYYIYTYYSFRFFSVH